MIDLNHGSGCRYDRVARCAGIGVAINAAIDAALVARNRALPPRRYVSTSGLGRECPRQIQYDYLAVPKDEGREFEPSTLRVFEAGHRGSDFSRCSTLSMTTTQGPSSSVANRRLRSSVGSVTWLSRYGPRPVAM